MMINKKSISMCLIILSLVLIFSGCNTLKVAKQIKDEPNVHGVSIKMGKNTVDVEVILNTNTEVKAIDELTERCKSIAKKEYKDKDINIKIIKAKWDTEGSTGYK